MKRTILFSLILIIALATLPVTGFAAVVHVDFEDVTTHSSEYFDVDGNGTFDVGVVWNYDDWADDTSAEASLPFGAPSDNGFVASGALAGKLAAGDKINAELNYRSDTVMLSKYWDDWDWDYYTWGNWDNMADGETAYLGFKFLDDDSAFHYGWIQAYVDPETQYITLYDLAWETTAELEITAGDIGSPVPVPAAIWLLASGLLGLAGIKRNKK